MARPTGMWFGGLLMACVGVGSCTTSSPAPISSPHRGGPTTAEAPAAGPASNREPEGGSRSIRAAAEGAKHHTTSPKPDAVERAYVPGELVEVAVGFDKRVLVVHAKPGQQRVLIYLHGVCGNPVAFEPWARSLVPHATLISLVGDRPCPGGYRHKWSNDVAGLDRRARAAVKAVEAARGEPLEHDQLAVAGYSQGALRAESLAKRFPDRYPHVVLMAGPLAPSLESVAQASRVVIMAGERDRQKHLRDAADQIADAGKVVRFIELPGAGHGEYGPEAEAVMSDMLGWLFQAG